MATKMNRIDHPPGFRRAGGRAPGAAMAEDLPEATDVERTADHQALRDQGLRLNRAFVQIKDPLVREAIVNLVVDAARNQSGEAYFLATDRRPKTGT
jgi:hypothetical protein